MSPRLRRMKAYHPRKRAKNIDLQKLTIRELERKISAEVSALILCYKEGNNEQIQEAKTKAESRYLKYSHEMQKIAEQMGKRYTQLVRDFLDSVDLVVHCSSAWIDEAKVHHCYNMTERLEKQLFAA